MVDLTFWIFSFTLTVASVLAILMLGVYLVYRALHRNDGKHIQHLDTEDNADISTLLGVVSPKTSENTNPPTLKNRK
jgi:hypothetical protein